jgi:hypothetical protein
MASHLEMNYERFLIIKMKDQIFGAAADGLNASAIYTVLHFWEGGHSNVARPCIVNPRNYLTNQRPSQSSHRRFHFWQLRHMPTSPHSRHS